jgi:hypothetical protein
LVQRVQTLRSSTKLQRPAAGTREPGELYVSFADLQLGVINAAKSPQDLIAVRFFSAATDYAIGAFVINAGIGYRAKEAITAGAFNAAQWDTLATSAALATKENVIVPGTVADYWRGDKTWVPLNKTTVGLGNVDNTSDANKPISNATQTALDAKVNKAGDTMSGHLVLPSGPGNTNAVRKDYVDSADTTLQNAINLKAPLANPTFTGDPKAPTPSPGDNDTSIATTAFVTSAVATGTAGTIGEAPIDGTQYVRQSAAWAPVSVPPGTAISDAAPSSPANGQLWWESDTGNMYIWYNDGSSQQWVQVNAAVPPGATAETRNRVVNGAMQISQENGNTAGTVVAYYPADQWQHTGIMPAGYTYSNQRVQVYTSNGSLYRIRSTVTVGAAMAAGNAVSLQQAIEGIRITDFLWGAGSARQAILRFGFKGPAGTYSISLRNGATNRAYVAPFTITAGQANTDTVQTLIIPGDTTGVWSGDTNPGIYLCICIAVGTTLAGAAGWQAGNIIGLTGQTNGVATNGNVFELFDVGLYLDPRNTGIAPPWAMPDEAQELLACQRYFQNNIVSVWCGNTTNAVAYLSFAKLAPSPMRVAPSLSGVNQAANGFPAATGSLTMYGTDGFAETRTANLTGNAAIYRSSCAANARM